MIYDRHSNDKTVLNSSVVMKLSTNLLNTEKQTVRVVNWVSENQSARLKCCTLSVNKLKRETIKWNQGLVLGKKSGIKH